MLPVDLVLAARARTEKCTTTSFGLCSELTEDLIPKIVHISIQTSDIATDLNDLFRQLHETCMCRAQFAENSSGQYVLGSKHTKKKFLQTVECYLSQILNI